MSDLALDAAIAAAVDWTPFAEFDPGVATCACGASWRTYTKVVSEGDRMVVVSQRPCPACGSHAQIRRYSTEPETLIVKGSA